MSTDDFSWVEDASFPSANHEAMPRCTVEGSFLDDGDDDADSWNDWQHHHQHRPTAALLIPQQDKNDGDEEEYVLASLTSSLSYGYVKTMATAADADADADASAEDEDEDSTSTGDAATAADWEWASDVASILTLPSGVWLSSPSDDDESSVMHTSAPSLSYKEVLLRAISREQDQQHDTSTSTSRNGDGRPNYQRLTKLSHIPESSAVCCLEQTFMMDHHHRRTTSNNSSSSSVCIQRTRLQRRMKFGRPAPRFGTAVGRFHP
jgi:hypothetical protein